MDSVPLGFVGIRPAVVRQPVAHTAIKTPRQIVRTLNCSSETSHSEIVAGSTLAGVLAATVVLLSRPNTSSIRRRATKAAARPKRPRKAAGFGAAAAPKKTPKLQGGVGAKYDPKKAKASALPFKGAREGGPEEDTEMPVVEALRKHGPEMIKGLREKGWWASDDPVLPSGLRKVLRREVEALWEEGFFEKSQSQRAGGDYYDKKNVFATEIAGDKYGTAPRLVHYTVRLGKELASMIRKEFPDVQISGTHVGNKLNYCVGNGASFDAHMDIGVSESAVDSSNEFSRRLTLLLYLNAWKPAHGGELTILGEGSTEAEAAAIRGDRTDVPVSLEPTAGRWVAFWSDKMLHKVEPSFAPGGPADNRVSYTIWFCTEMDDSAPKVAEVVSDVAYEQAPSFTHF